MTQTIEDTRRLIAETARETKCKDARLAMAKLASGPLSNLAPANKSLWADYYDAGAPAECA